MNFLMSSILETRHFCLYSKYTRNYCIFVFVYFFFIINFYFQPNQRKSPRKLNSFVKKEIYVEEKILPPITMNQNSYLGIDKMPVY